MAYEQQAKAAGDARFAGEERSILTQQQLAAIRAQQEAAALNQWGQTGTQAINDSFAGLLSDMQANRGNAMNVLNQQSQAVGQGYDDVARGNQLVRDESRQYLQRLMGNYGISDQAVAEIQSPMEQLTNQLIERNTRYGQDARTALGNWAAQHDVLYGDAQTNARGAQAFSQSAFQSQLGNLLAQSQAAQRQREIEFASALQGLAAQRGGFEVEYAQGLADRDSDRNLKMAEMQMRANLEQAQLDAAASRFNAENSYRQDDTAWEKEKFYASLGLDRDKFDFEKWMAMNEQGEGVDPWESGGVLGMRQMSQQLGNPELFMQAQQLLDMASADPMANEQNVGQIATRMLKDTPYGRSLYKSVPYGTGYSQEYQDLLDMIAIGSGR